MKRSGLQKEILSFYRTTLRAIRSKPKENQANFKKFIRIQFDRYKDLDVKDFNTIEFLLRKGRKQLEIYQEPEIKNVNI